MIEHILKVLSPDFILVASAVSVFVLLLAFLRPDLCFAAAFPAYLYLGLLSYYFPVSNSAGAAAFPLVAAVAAFIRRPRFRLGLCEILMIGLGVLMAVSILYSPNRTYGQDKSALFCFMIVPLVVLAPNVITSAKDLRSVVVTIVMTMMTFVLASLIMRWQMKHVMERVSGLLEPTRAAQFLGLAVMICYVYVFYRHGLLKKVFFLAVLPVAVILLFMTGTRGPILTVVLSVAFVYWFVHLDWFQRIFTKAHITFVSIMAGIAALVFGVVVMRHALPESVYQRFTSLESFLSNFTPSEIANWRESSGRALNYGTAIWAYGKHPLTGIGAGGYKTALAECGGKTYKRGALDPRAHAYPHNVILEFASEQGTLGLLVFLWILYLNFKTILRLRRVYNSSPQGYFPILPCAVIFAYGFFVAMTALDIPRMMVLWWGMALLLAADRLCREDSQRAINRQPPKLNTRPPKPATPTPAAEG